MDKFKLINWNVPLENLIDDVFISDERIQRDSATYQIINGIFKDPFDNIEEDYTEVNTQLLKCFNENVSDLDKDEDEENFTIKEQEEQHEQNTKNLQKHQKKQEIVNNKKSYIPGIKKQPINFPRKSSLNCEQQATCTRALLRLLSNQIISISAEEKTELEHYMALQKVISAEQSEFLKFAKKMWDEDTSWCIKHEIYIELKWGKQMIELKKLPRYYVESSNVPFSSNKNVTVKCVSYLQQGVLSKVVLPKFDEPYILEMDNTTLFKKYPVCLSSSLPPFKLPVSEDIYCTNFAEEAKVDLVISSSGLKCIVNNIGSDYSNSWTIPVIIKPHNGKNVIYIDKKLPPVAATASQKNTWVYKYILRHCLVPTEIKSPKKEVTSTEKDEPLSEVDEEFNEISSFLMSDDEINLEKNPLSSTNMQEKKNVTYKLFTIGPTESQDQYKLLKDIPKEYQILVRTKTNFIEVLPNGQLQSLILVPKLEHQLSLGAEAATLEEGLQQWVSLVFSPNTLLARVRIAAESGEVIQIERHTAMSLSNEIKRLHNVKVEDSLSLLHNVIERLSCLMPGRYIMRHIAQHGPFAYVYKKVEECGKNTFDLHSIYETFKTIPVTPWPPIDTMLMTPTLKHFNKMPAMFNPCKIKTFESSNMTPGTSGVKQHTTKKQNISKSTVPVRRSLREKRPSRKLADI
ncbi:uncharacterized protein LOC116848663 [Odontomachus brunneus]|uniref:uncharacterized protein LOC116848663 n=1 Tax=Odontomachus brunneus TaxID=486640 RepID=UPI0013F206C2|nr:uncharacterized protein LOC116848663 [Odontomachus brunneus]